MEFVTFPTEPCRSLFAHGKNHGAADVPCATFTSQGFGPEGDYEHSLFCTCGWERADHGEPEEEIVACTCLPCLVERENACSICGYGLFDAIHDACVTAMVEEEG